MSTPLEPQHQADPRKKLRSPQGLVMAAPGDKAWPRTLHPAMEIPGMPLPPAISACLHRASRATLHRHRLGTAECRRHRQSACGEASSRLLPQTLTTSAMAIVQLTARCDSARRTPSRVIEKVTVTGLTHGACNSPARRAGGTRCCPTSVLSVSQDRSILKHPQPSHRSAGPALRPDQKIKKAVRQVASFSPGIPDLRGSHPSLLARHLKPQRPVAC